MASFSRGHQNKNLGGDSLFTLHKAHSLNSTQLASLKSAFDSLGFLPSDLNTKIPSDS